jgi:hypothetical protein
MAWVDDIVTLLQEAEEQIKDLEPLHDAALDDASVRGKFKARVKNVLEHERSALDYLAVGITTDFGTPKKGRSTTPSPSVTRTSRPPSGAGCQALLSRPSSAGVPRPYVSP